MNLDPLT